MGYLIVAEEMVDLSITEIDSTLLKAKGGVCHKSSMKKGEIYVLASIQMQDGGYSHTKRWIFGYELHLTSTTANRR